MILRPLYVITARDIGESSSCVPNVCDPRGAPGGVLGMLRVML